MKRCSGFWILVLLSCLLCSAGEPPARIYHKDAISAELTDNTPIPSTPITHKPVFVGEREQFGYAPRFEPNVACFDEKSIVFTANGDAYM